MVVRDVIVGLGQSNMDGQGLNSSLPVGLQGPISGASVWNNTSGVIEVLDASTGNNKTVPPIGIGTHGPEITLADAAVAELGAIDIIKYAPGGTSMGPSVFSWHPNKLPIGDILLAFGNAFELFKINFAAYNAAAVAGGDTLNVLFVVWFQGEQDVLSNGLLHETYLGGLRYLMIKVREYLAPYSTTSILPWVTCMIHAGFIPTSFGYLHAKANTVRSAQLKAGWSDPAYRVVDTAFFSLKSDALHLDSEGQQQCGYAIWDAYKSPRNNS